MGFSALNFNLFFGLSIEKNWILFTIYCVHPSQVTTWWWKLAVGIFACLARRRSPPNEIIHVYQMQNDSPGDAPGGVDSNALKSRLRR